MSKGPKAPSLGVGETALHYEGVELLRTTETGIKVNKKAPLLRRIWAMIQYYFYYKWKL